MKAHERNMKYSYKLINFNLIDTTWVEMGMFTFSELTFLNKVTKSEKYCNSNLGAFNFRHFWLLWPKIGDCEMKWLRSEIILYIKIQIQSCYPALVTLNRLAVSHFFRRRVISNFNRNYYYYYLNMNFIVVRNWTKKKLAMFLAKYFSFKILLNQIFENKCK